MNNQESYFIQGANAGYILAQYAPQVLSKIDLTAFSLPGYFSGLIFGFKEYAREKERNELRQLAEIRDKGRSMEREL